MSTPPGRAASSGNPSLARRVRLPADRRTPAAARAVVRAILAEAQLNDLLDEALLLTTELATNGVMHAGTDLDIEVAADRTGLTVTVTDFAPGPAGRTQLSPDDTAPISPDDTAPASSTVPPAPPAPVVPPAPPAPVVPPAPPGPAAVPAPAAPGSGPVAPQAAQGTAMPQAAQGTAMPQAPFPAAFLGRATTVDELLLDPDLSERGRGLLLVDHFATRWGTTHMPTGKGVWFRLDRWRGRSAGPDAVAAGDRTRTTGPGRPHRDESDLDATGDGLVELIQVTLEPHADDPLAELARTLLIRAGDLLGATGATVRIDRGDGAGPQLLARYGRTPHRDAERVTAPLTVNRPYVGELEIDAAPSTYARSVAALVAERLSLHLENDRLRRADLRRQSWLTFLAEASELLAQSLDVQLTMALIPQLVVPRLGRWCAVHTTDEWGQFNLAATAHADETMLTELHAALKESGPESPAARLREALRVGATIVLNQPLEGLGIPLVARGQRLGTLSVGRHLLHRHDPDEVAVLEDVARRAALAVDNARIHDERRRVAHALQQSLLPPVLPVVANLGFAAEYVPSGDAVEVGGDFYDVVPLAVDRWLVVVGDVSGKGVQAAAVTGLVRDVIRVLAQDGRALPDMLARLNDTLVERGSGRYCTLAMAEVVRAGADRLDVTLYLAGHDRPVLLGGSGRAGFVGAGGTALGLLREIESPGVSLSLTVGEALVFYTDGVTERRRGRELFGVDRLRAAAVPLAGFSADVVAARLRSTVLGFSAEPPRDDIAILVLRNEPSATH